MQEISSKLFHSKWRNFQKICEILGFDGELPAVSAIGKLSVFLVKNWKKITSKTFNRKLGNFKKIPEILGFDGEFAVIHPIVKFRIFLVKICRKSALKQCTGN